MNTTPLTRNELIVILIQNYEDVLHGLRDTKGTGEHIPLMCAAWNHSSYQQLEHHLRTLRTKRPRLYWHLAETHIRPNHSKLMVCPRCSTTHPAWHHPGHHVHGRRHVTLTPRITRQPHPEADPAIARQAIDWINQHWAGPIVLPVELQHLAA